jgi:hypothetical protein
LNRFAAVDVVRRLEIVVLEEDFRGVDIKRVVDGVEEWWRIYTTGGVLANVNEVWLRPLGNAVGRIRGPFHYKTEFEDALRAWRRGE